MQHRYLAKLVTVASAVILAGIVVLVTTIGLAADPSRVISYQGRLTTPAGAAVPDGPYLIRFVIYDAPAAGNVLWDAGFQTVVVSDGLFSVGLGSAPMPVLPEVIWADSSRWLGIRIGTDPELSPRTQLGSGFGSMLSMVAMGAVSANYAVTAGQVPWSGITGMPAGFADGVDNGSTYGAQGPVVLIGSNFDISSNSITSSHIQNSTIADGDISASAAILPSKISGTAATLGAGQTFTNRNTFNSDVKVGDSAFYVTPGYSVVMGQTPITYSDRLLHLQRIWNSPTTRYGLFTQVVNNGSGESVAGFFRSSGGNVNKAIYCEVSSGSGSGYAGFFNARYSGSAGKGVYANAEWSASSNTGVYAKALGTNPTGVYAESWGDGDGSWATYGVYGLADGSFDTPMAFGIYGYALRGSSANYAGYFSGNAAVTGTLSKGGGSFKIDHPLDPENRYLQHSFVESPDMMNIYNGNITTDADGNATVTMPDWFDALNRDFRYQLTVMGQFAQAMVSNKMNGNSFSIKTDRPNVEVSWQVTGVRKDAYANANRIQVEVIKRTDEKGRYLHPEAFGLDESRGVEYPERKRIEAMNSDRAASLKKGEE